MHKHQVNEKEDAMKNKNSDLLNQFSKQMIKQRMKKNMSHEQLSEIVDCHVNTISNIENAKTYPSFEMAMKISKILKISLDDIINQVLLDIDI